MAFKTVTREEFDAALSAHPREWNADTVTICEPPVRGYYDKPTNLAIGLIILNTAMKGHRFYDGSADEYKLTDESPADLDRRHEAELARRAEKCVSFTGAEKGKIYDPSKCKVTFDDVEITRFGPDQAIELRSLAAAEDAFGKGSPEVEAIRENETKKENDND